MKKLNSLFILLFMGMLIVPLLLTNVKKDQVSGIDNRKLPELNWSDAHVPVNDRIANAEEYLNMRIGLREISLTAYQLLNDRLFHLMEHPTYMYGKDGWVFFRNDDYVRDYQHLNLDQELIDRFTGWLQGMSDISREHGADFLYVLVPDKKTVYSEYFPEGINVRGDMSRTDMLLDALRQTDIEWMYLYDAMAEAKKSGLVNNVKYDAGHWNEDGAFAALRAVYERLREKHPDIRMLEEEQFTITTEHKSSLQVSHFPIDEDVPLYKLKKKKSGSDKDWLDANLEFADRNAFRARYVNPENEGLPKLLIFNDSYLAGKQKFFRENFSEVTMIHHDNLVNYQRFEEYLNALEPDIVIFENPERVLSTVMDTVWSFRREQSDTD